MESWTPEQVDRALKAGDIILVDVREPNEFANERIAGALLHPLSTFQPHALPVGQGRKVVLHCAAGGRSSQALQACEAAGVDVYTHMAGGLGAWKDAGFSFYRVEPTTGQMVIEN